jgi:hypothetical protein
MATNFSATSVPQRPLVYIPQTKTMSCWYACMMMLLIRRGDDPAKVFGPKAMRTFGFNRGTFTMDGAERTGLAVRNAGNIMREQAKQQALGFEGPSVGGIILDAALVPFSLEDILKECRLHYTKMFVPVAKDEKDYEFLVKQYGPIATLINKPNVGGHVVIVTGVRKGAVITHDPDPKYGANYPYPVSRFNQMVMWGESIPFFWS